MTQMLDVTHLACTCAGCAAGATKHEYGVEGYTLDASLDPEAGGSYAGKTIFSLEEVVANLQRTGQNWYVNNGDSIDDGVLNFGFWLNQEEINNSYYVNNDGTIAFGEVFRFQTMNAQQRDLARDSMDLWDEVIAIGFAETKSFNADITFGNINQPGTQAYAYLPFGDVYDDLYKELYNWEDIGKLSGDIWIGAQAPSNFFPIADSYYSKATMVHEIGHALGLSHPGDYNASDDDDGDGVPDPITYANDAFFAQDSRQYSTMSYFDAYETGAQHVDFALLNFAYGATPLIHDIATVQAIYGADMTTRTGDTVYGFNSTAGPSAFDFTINTRPIVAIWDAGGNDTLDFSGWNTDSVIDLNDGAFSSGGGIEKFLTLEEVNANRAALGFAARTQATFDFYEDLKAQFGLTTGLFKDNISIAYGVTVENAVGGGGDDFIIANEVANNINGGAGLDTVSYQTATGRVNVDLSTGRANGASGFDKLTSIENVIGSDSGDVLIGSTASNVIEGGLGSDRLTGGGGSDLFVFRTLDNATGPDRIADFGVDDFIATDKRLVDNDRDGFINPAANGTLSIDRTDGDSVVLTGNNASLAMSYLGEQDGLYYYGTRADAPVAGANQTVAISTAGDEVLTQTRDAAVTDIFFFDSGAPVPTGDDRLTFTANDLIVTTSAIDTLVLDDGILELSSGTVEVRIAAALGNTFEFDGTITNDGETYYVYSVAGSSVGVADVAFATLPTAANIDVSRFDAQVMDTPNVFMF